MHVYSFGCSLIFGTDLADDGRDRPYATASNLTWPALIAQQLNTPYKCLAQGGSGNLQILGRLLDRVAVNNTSEDLYIIGWSWIDRYDYTTDINEHGRQFWASVMPIDETDVARTYYRHLHSEYRDKLTSLQCVRTAIDVLTQKGCSFIMTYQDELMFDTAWNSSPGIAALQDYVRPYMHTFDGQTFVDWSRDRGFEISATLHPLEPAHAAAAELMLPVAQRLV
jgi:hypothetical protein